MRAVRSSAWSDPNVARVIKELERFPDCYVRGTDTFNVDKVAEWVRVNAAPYAERMEPPAFLSVPEPESSGDSEVIDPLPEGGEEEPPTGADLEVHQGVRGGRARHQEHGCHG